MSTVINNRDRVGSELSFVTSQGQRLRARLRELREESLTFELVGGEGVLQLSEFLREVVVMVNGKVVYEGEATVSGIVGMGVTVLCEIHLKNRWLAMEIDMEEGPEGLRENLRKHTVKWAKDHEIRPMFRAVVADLETYLSGLESWCHQVECGWISPGGNREAKELEVLNSVGPTVAQEIASHFADFEMIAKRVEPELRWVHRQHLMRAVHRFILQSPFSYRCYTKPLGYAGDYEMVNLMMGDPFSGVTLFAKLLNNAFLQTGPVVAHRNRIQYLENMLKSVATKRAAEGKRTRILNLGCGPAQEVRNFIESEQVSEMCDFELLDFSAETLRFTEKKINECRTKARRGVNVKFIEESIQSFLRQAGRGTGFEQSSYDVVYCAGLFDYLQQKFCAKLVSVFRKLVKDGGLVVVTNVSDANTIPNVMEDFLEWSIIHRNSHEMNSLTDSEKLGDLKELKSDSTQINYFLELRKAASKQDVEAAIPVDEGVKRDRSRVSGEIRGGGSRLPGAELSHS